MPRRHDLTYNGVYNLSAGIIVTFLVSNGKLSIHEQWGFLANLNGFQSTKVPPFHLFMYNEQDAGWSSYYLFPLLFCEVMRVVGEGEGVPTRKFLSSLGLGLDFFLWLST